MKSMIKKGSVLNHLVSEDLKEFIEKGEKILTQLKQQTLQTISSRINLLDKFEYILADNKMVSSGDILKRPVKSFKIGQPIGVFHYGIVFGLSKNSEKLILDMSDETDISVRSLDDFIKPYTINDVIIVSKPETTSFIEILERADTLITERYSVENLNCEQFVNFCVYNKAESIGLQNTSKFMTSLIDILTAYTEYKLAYTPNSKSKESIESFNNKLKAMSTDLKLLK